MATVTFTADMPNGVQVYKLFSALAGSISFEQSGGAGTASFQIFHPDGNPDHKVDVFYSGPELSDTSGRVSYIKFSFNGTTWLTIGALNGPAIFSYQDLASFHSNGIATAMAVFANADNLVGSAKGDFIEAYAGNDTLNGGGGADTLYGGAGDDIYIVDNPDDRVLEAIDEGYDTIETSVSIGLAENSEIEVLRASASSYSLELYGNRFANLIIGSSGHDTLGGNGGADTLIGGAGNDTYLVDNVFQTVREDAWSGYDTVIASISYTLTGNVEVLKASAGAGAVTLVGNALANEIFGNADSNVILGLHGDDWLYGDAGHDTIYGGAGNDHLYGGPDINNLYGENGNDRLFGGEHVDTLVGGAGNDQLRGDAGNDYLDGGPGRDTLWGGSGRDSFVFRDRLSAKTNVDSIKDFQINLDKIRLENSIFKKLGKAGKLKSDFFTVGTSAKDANDHIVFNKKTGVLSYDADGSGPTKAIAFAKLTSGLKLDAGDFLVI
jgi:serralysin